MKNEIKVLIYSIENSDDWQQGGYYLYNTKTQCKIWTANGFSFIDFRPAIQAFSLWEKIRIHRAIKIRNIKNAVRYKEQSKTELLKR
tara:strand:- start:910 stop:1170 length:261 start_codon:yes stop_codon:yes gene_type:complete